eukprot:TRINITY_DN19171_c0_g1_i1.p1 TRINITY_DN19171_c0_g1~~TRINITY_DN19171_c0_g1_i1.p1  ORF type:complete len:365 (+),score=54.79 TRINITY_DN19171_c0_g1_i1:2-1096(+)
MNVESTAQREAARTPNIIGCCRRGRSMKLKESTSEQNIALKEEMLIRKAMAAFTSMSNVVLLDCENWAKRSKRLPIFSFNVKSHGTLLHYNFVVKLLNDMFGVQTRGGCACAAVYALNLLGISDELSSKYNQVIGKGYEVMKVGFVRLNFSYWISDEEFDYIIKCVEWVSQYGWLLLPHYTFDVAKSLWHHRSSDIAESKRIWLNQIDYSSGKMTYPIKNDLFYPHGFEKIDPDIFKIAHEELQKALGDYKHIYGKAQLDQESLFSEPDLTGLRWFLLPSEVIEKAKTIFELKKPVEGSVKYEKLALPFPGGFDTTMIIHTAKSSIAKELSAEPRGEEEEFLFPDIEEEKNKRNQTSKANDGVP